MPVSVRTRFATAKARRQARPRSPFAVPAASAAAKASFTWPRFCGSPTCIESRLEATRKRCRTASPPAWA